MKEKKNKATWGSLDFSVREMWGNCVRGEDEVWMGSDNIRTNCSYFLLLLLFSEGWALSEGGVISFFDRTAGMIVNQKCGQRWSRFGI